ncbi:MAG: RHS repeat-associated core domain-containing protein [Fimbriimonadaceae bacterium]|nr:RHS repeat-associated core domain-containing protein [Fimbriimonadaceae bacterium]
MYDAAGNLVEKTVNSVTTEYAYDDIDQLVSEVRNGYSASYTYDANGNRTSKTLNGTTQSYVVDDADKLTSITQGGNTVKSFTYDAAGRTTAVTVGNDTTSIAYDYESRITQITYPNQSTNSFSYNGQGTRVSKVDSTGTRTYLRYGAYVTDPVLTDGAATYTPWISERRSSVTKFYHPDRLGTTERLTDTNESTTDTRQYDAFGLLTSSSGSTPTPFGFAGAWGYQEDPDSGLKLLGHRYYDSSTGRFLTRDPIKDGRNWYGYCESNPIDRVDPAGDQSRGTVAAERAEGAVGKGPKDCEDWIRKHVYPGEWTDCRAHELPSKLDNLTNWDTVTNDGRFQPGDLICIDKGDMNNGHVLVVGNKRRVVKRKIQIVENGKKVNRTIDVNQIDVIDASLDTRNGTRHWIDDGTPYVDPWKKRNGAIKVYRPRD